MLIHIACRTILAAALLGAATAHAETETRSFTFESESGRTHAARLLLPAEDDRNGFAVLLIGGGTVQDMHWTIPGVVDTPQGRMQFTIDGQSTRDGDTLANAIADAGFIVMQWSSIFEGDPLHAENPAMATPMEYPDSVRLAGEALAVMREQPEVNADQIILLGHSLGATRACQIADEDVAGVVMLAGAYIARIGARPTDINAATLGRWASVDANHDSLITPDEFENRVNVEGAPVVHASFEMLDADDSGALAGWERSAGEILGHIEPVAPIPFPQQTEFREGVPWAIDVLLERRGVPALALYASRDPISVHGPVLAEVARLMGLASLTIEYAPDLGHQFSKEEDGRIASIESSVVERVVDWLRDTFAPQRND